MTAAALRKALMGLVLIGGLALVAARQGATESDGPPRSNAPGLMAIHDSNSPSFNKNCLQCHQDVMTRGTLDSKIKDAHAAMVPFAPGYDSKRGATNEVCIVCHTNTDVLQHSAAQIRKNVSTSLCAACHNKSGPSSKKFYAN
jgi:hypothetical protein